MELTLKDDVYAMMRAAVDVQSILAAIRNQDGSAWSFDFISDLCFLSGASS
jgi:hypothetical protein